jgi:hypothetical protein
MEVMMLMKSTNVVNETAIVVRGVEISRMAVGMKEEVRSIVSS